MKGLCTNGASFFADARGFGFFAALYCAMPVLADDTEIFFPAETTTGASRVNVLLVLDTSNSMETEVDGTGISRREMMAKALQEALADFADINIGLMNFPGGSSRTDKGAASETDKGGRMVFPIKPIDDPAWEGAGDLRKVREVIVDEIGNHGTMHLTPVAGALSEAFRYFTGMEVHYGLSRGNGEAMETGARADDHLHYRPSHPLSWTGPAATPAGCFNQSSDECLTESIPATEDEPASYLSPVENSCQRNSVILLSDGEPYPETRPADLVAEVKALTGDGTDCAAGECENRLAALLLASDIRVHTIGFETADAYLKTIAANGGGEYYTAFDADSLVDAFRSSLAASSDAGAFALPAIPASDASRVADGKDFYFALYKPDLYRTWFGNLKKFRFDPEDGRLEGVDPDIPALLAGEFHPMVQSFWSAVTDGAQVPLGGMAGQLKSVSRKVYSNLNCAATGHCHFTADENNRLALANSGPDSDDDPGGIRIITKSLLGLEDSPDTDLLQEELVAWAGGADIYDYDGDPDTDVRSQIGDPLHSRPAAVRYQTSDLGGTYIYLSTNEGYLHAVRSTDGHELWSFVPRDLLVNFREIAQRTGITTAHTYGLDGQIAILHQDRGLIDGKADADGIVDDDDRAFLVVGMRRGGRQYYVLDISRPGQPALMYTLTGDPDMVADAASYPDPVVHLPDLGQTWAKPVTGTIRVNGVDTLVLVFSGGYDPRQDDETLVAGQPVDPGDASVHEMGSNIYIVDLLTGALLWNAKDDVVDAPGIATVGEVMTSSLPADLAAFDLTGSGYIEHIYAADSAGQVFRFDIDNETAASKPVITGGRIADLQTDASGEPETGIEGNRRFYARPDIAYVRRPDGKSFVAVSLGSGYRAHPLNKSVRDYFFSLRDTGILAGKFAMDSTLADLVDITKVGGDYEAVIGAEGKNGWYLALDWASGEKILESTVTFNGTLRIPAYVPADESCTGNLGATRLYAVDLATGAPARDVNADGFLDATDRLVRSADGDGALTPGISGVGLYFTGQGRILGLLGNGFVEIDEELELEVVKWREQDW